MCWLHSGCVAVGLRVHYSLGWVGTGAVDARTLGDAWFGRMARMACLSPTHASRMHAPTARMLLTSSDAAHTYRWLPQRNWTKVTTVAKAQRGWVEYVDMVWTVLLSSLQAQQRVIGTYGNL